MRATSPLRSSNAALSVSILTVNTFLPLSRTVHPFAPGHDSLMPRGERASLDIAVLAVIVPIEVPGAFLASGTVCVLGHDGLGVILLIEHGVAGEVGRDAL